MRKIKAAFLDGLYAFLDGLVHVAFSDPETIFATARKDGISRAGPKEVDVSNVVSLENLSKQARTLY